MSIHRLTNRLRAAAAMGVAGLLLAAPGCTTSRTTDTARTGMEQLLVSNAVDQALSKVDFTPLAGVSVYMESKFLDCTDKNYVLAALRHEVLAVGAKVVEKPEDAEQILEIRSGAVGTDRSDSFVGSPGLSVPGVLPIELPEVRIVARNAQYGTAKLGIVLYDAKTKNSLGLGGTALARSDETKWMVMGVPVYNGGSVRKEIVTSGADNELPTTLNHMVDDVNPLATARRGKVQLVTPLETATPAQVYAEEKRPQIDPNVAPVEYQGAQQYPPADYAAPAYEGRYEALPGYSDRTATNPTSVQRW